MGHAHAKQAPLLDLKPSEMALGIRCTELIRKISMHVMLDSHAYLTSVPCKALALQSKLQGH